MNASMLLARLTGVRRSGDGWRANCPNGHAKARGSLSVTEADDGRVLLHCFACSDVPGILSAVGLEMADLFPERIKDPSPEGRQRAREAFKRNAWHAALGVLAREANVVLLAVGDLLAGRTLPVDDMERLALAYRRIAQAKEVLA